MNKVISLNARPAMNGILSRPSLKTAVAVLTIACFLAFAQGAVSGALAADAASPTTAQAQTPAPAPAPSDTWETWPKKPEGAGNAGTSAGAKTSSGMSAGTIALITLGVGAAIAIGVAAAGGGGGSSSTPTH
jgi:hypothetical protein